MEKDADESNISSLNSEDEMRSEQQVVKATLYHGKEDNNTHSGSQDLSQLPEKRMRPESEENTDDAEFITVRRNPKRLHRSSLRNYDSGRNSQSEHLQANDYCDVYVTSKEVLPKQIGLAKLLRDENIQGITKILYKNPYKVQIQFENRQYAEKILICEKIKNLGYRCQLAQEVNLSYGIVKNVELEVNEEELIHIFTSEFEIVSVKRLKRSTDEGKWEDCETVRICFKGSVVPTYVEVYGCKFKVESYTFPVAQCSKCWKFGHLQRQCTIKRFVCPKCGGAHANCEVTRFCCVNCKGSHMSFNKTCPVFLKEKDIRHIMSSENCTYKKALYMYLEKSGKEEKAKQSQSKEIYEEERERTIVNNNNNIDIDCSMDAPEFNPSFRDILIKNKEKETPQSKTKNGDQIQRQNKKGNRRGVPETNTYSEVQSSEGEVSKSNNVEYDSKAKKKKTRNISFWEFIKHIKDIMLSSKSFEERINEVFNFFIEKIQNFFKETVKNGEWIKKIIDIFYG